MSLKGSSVQVSTQVTPDIPLGKAGYWNNSDVPTFRDSTGADTALGPSGLLATTAPVDVTKAAAVIGVGTKAARNDHKHDIFTAVAGTAAVGDVAAEGVATSLARSDHKHAFTAPGAPVNVTKAAASAGASVDFARADHKHDATTAAPTATGVATASAEGVATSFARSDHAHQSNTAPVNVTKAAAAIGTSDEPARADHKHDVTTAAPIGTITPGVTANAEGAASSMARSDHTHFVAASSLTTQNVNQNAVGNFVTASVVDVPITGLVLTLPAAATYLVGYSVVVGNSGGNEDVVVTAYGNAGVPLLQSQRAHGNVTGNGFTTVSCIFFHIATAADLTLRVRCGSGGGAATVYSNATSPGPFANASAAQNFWWIRLT